MYILDTNALSDYVKGFEPTTTRIKTALRDGDSVYLSQPVEYELKRGFLVRGATRQQQIFETVLAPQLTPLSLIDADWQQAAQFWADARNAGKQLSDVDLLIAALAHRLNTVIVSADADFDALTVKHEDWRQP